MENTNSYKNIPAEKFRFTNNRSTSDEKFKTKQIGYLEDAWHRFRKNKSSIVASIIIVVLLLYSIIVPLFCETTYSKSLTDTTYLTYTKLLPKSKFFQWLGWDGCHKVEVTDANLNYYRAIEEETGVDVVRKIYGSSVTEDGRTVYEAKLDSYSANGFLYMTLSQEKYESIQAWQNETGIQVIYPAIKTKNVSDANIWYEANAKGVAILDKDGNFVNVYKTSGNDGNYSSLRIEGDPGLEDPEAKDRYRYATVTGDSSSISYKCRIFKYTYFQYRYGFEPCFLFGTNSLGQDIFTRLATGARFSFLLLLLFQLLTSLLVQCTELLRVILVEH